MRVLHYPAEKRPAFLVARLRRQPTFLTPIARRHVGHWTEQRAERPGRLVAPGLALVAEAPAPPAAWFDPYDWLVESGRPVRATRASQEEPPAAPDRIGHDLGFDATRRLRVSMWRPRQRQAAPRPESLAGTHQLPIQVLSAERPAVLHAGPPWAPAAQR